MAIFSDPVVFMFILKIFQTINSCFVSYSQQVMLLSG